MNDDGPDVRELDYLLARRTPPEEELRLRQLQEMFRQQQSPPDL